MGFMPSHLQSLYPRLPPGLPLISIQASTHPTELLSTCSVPSAVPSAGHQDQAGLSQHLVAPCGAGRSPAGAPFPGSLSAYGVPKPSLSPFTFPDSLHLSPSRVGPFLYSTYQARMHAKSLWSCPTLCDPMHSSPAGSSVHRILQARILEWVAISFSSTYHSDLTNYSCTKVAFCNHWFLSGVSTREKMMV